MKQIKIVTDFTDSPGARNLSDGTYTGEAFRNNLLRPVYDSLAKNEKLLIDFDGAFGYPPSFLEEAFGGLVRDIGNLEEPLERLQFKSDEEPNIIERVLKCMQNALRKK